VKSINTWTVMGSKKDRNSDRDNLSSDDEKIKKAVNVV
jgi:hypothetical protein